MGGEDEVESDCGIPVECGRAVPGWLVALDNLPTAVMFALGATLIWLAWWPLAVAFLAYCALSIVLFWRLICPYCHHFDTRACPCGYGVVAPRLFRRRGGAEFRRVFRQRIGIMFPAWFLPLGVGVHLLWSGFSWLPMGLLVGFCVVAFALIPAISRFVGCRGCEIRGECPWMTRPSDAGTAPGLDRVDAR